MWLSFKNIFFKSYFKLSYPATNNYNVPVIDFITPSLHIILPRAYRFTIPLIQKSSANWINIIIINYNMTYIK